MTSQQPIRDHRTGAEDAPILQALNLTKEFRQRGLSLTGEQGTLRALDDVSFDLLPGRTLGLVGESGCGKSTLAHVLLGLMKPTRGSVCYQGENVFAMDRAALRAFRRNVQIVFQDPEASLSPRLRAEDIIREAWIANPGIVPREKRHDRVLELMSLVGLNPSYVDRYPHQFSGGQRQRLGIARALAVEPRVLVCDEPVSSLDVSVQAQIINLFQRLQQELGVSYLFIAHDLAVVRHIAQSVAVMRHGRIVEYGPTEQVYDAPHHPYTRKLLAAIPLPEPPGRLAGNESLDDRGDDDPGGTQAQLQGGQPGPDRTTVPPSNQSSPPRRSAARRDASPPARLFRAISRRLRRLGMVDQQPEPAWRQR